MYWLIVNEGDEVVSWEEEYRGYFDTLEAAFERLKTTKEYKQGCFYAQLLKKNEKGDLKKVAHYGSTVDYLSDADIQSRNLPPNYKYRVRKRGWKIVRGKFRAMEEYLEYEVIDPSLILNSQQHRVTGMYYTPAPWKLYED